ncbi:MAG: GNAT family N-acetyltransferase [Nanoarchaeota archaeon]|nr:GNAT family N-acetyltransferase [Nanoarchaeota archaeon]MBU1632383.1 GNAT family N-acetyltransferase [Nanoarchaeota archaeon]MBU1876687.1 GNAT family N-acetyltransferase [Nanoarchaeota archaeon]
MIIKNKEVIGTGIKVVAELKDKEIARGYLYFLHNDLHDKPFALMEDVFVDEEFRSQGVGKKIVHELIRVAKEKNCYKIIGTSRHSRGAVHNFYQDLGFENYGLEFRMNLE